VGTNDKEASRLPIPTGCGFLFLFLLLLVYAGYKIATIDFEDPAKDCYDPPNAEMAERRREGNEIVEAINGYRKAKNKFPETLEEIGPEYFKDVKHAVVDRR
jgi:hypothetical protein